jgi:hypothetical protein
LKVPEQSFVLRGGDDGGGLWLFLLNNEGQTWNAGNHRRRSSAIISQYVCHTQGIIGKQGDQMIF